jgi:carboxymethylenebutenolidase
VTLDIAKFMRTLEARWDAHLDALLGARDLHRAMADMVPEPTLRHLPVMTGAAGRAGLERFYAEDLLPHLPADLTLTRVSRTVDRFRLVDETTVAFTHDRELPWLLPGLAATECRAEVLAIAVVGFNRGLISSQRVLWDLATLSAQLGLPAPAAALAGDPDS